MTIKQKTWSSVITQKRLEAIIEAREYLKGVEQRLMDDLAAGVPIEEGNLTASRGTERAFIQTGAELDVLELERMVARTL